MTRSMIKRLICLVLSLCLILSTAAVAENTEQTVVYEPLRYEMKNSDEVRQMQLRLRELGFLEAGATGGYYGKTADAVEAFQKAAGLEVNRKLASAEMLALLFSEEAPTVDGGVFEPTPVPTPEPEGVLKFSLKDSDGVRQAQKRLAELGYFHSSITGNFFGATQAAIEEFQAKVGLPVNGRVLDDETLKALYSESAPAKDASLSATVTPLPTPTPTPVLTPAPNATPRPALYYSNTSAAIKEMQLRLKELKYLKASATGSYWKETANAIAEFQEDAGLPVNGRVASTETLEILFSADAPVKGGPVSNIPALTTLYFGQSGSSAVRYMQDRLSTLGYFKNVSTGGYYLETAAAVAAFQAAAGLPVNGNIATVEMLQLLYSENAPAYGEILATPTPVPTETPAPTATAKPEESVKPEETAAPAETPVPTVAPEATQEVYAELRYSMTQSDAVRRLQAKLQELGYLDVNPTGGYWSKTVKAVKEFLSDNGMSGNGKTATGEMQRLLFSKSLGDEDAEDVLAYETLKYGMKKSSAVKALQTRLRALGYFDESSTGNYYSITAAAVAAFQQAAGLEVNRNVASAEMQALLFSADAPAFGTTDSEPEEGGDGTDEQPELSTDYKPLAYGTRDSDDVRAMQKKLKERGFFSVNPTGGYWGETQKAVAAFQAYCGLTVNGRLASAETLGYLFYEGDLDKLLASGAVPPAEDDGEEDTAYDPEKYKDANVNTLLSKGDSGAQVKLLIARLSELGYLDDSDPTTYDSDVVSAVKWFQNTNLLDSDGIAGPATLKKIYSAGAMSADDGMKDNTSSDPIEVEGEEIQVSIGTVLNVDWFSDAGKTYYDRRSGQFGDGDIAIITDVATGISFRVKRSGGYNHADAEPLTAFDTWQMYRIYKSEWSWSRHAIYVTLESGVTLAGSMNGMPHGSGSISDNNFDGHFCIHFLNSRTHGTDKVDPDHQAAVAKAAGR